MAGWSALQLTEFFSAITRAGDVASAARIAVQRAAEATDASAAAVICQDTVLASVGLGRSPDPVIFTGVEPGAPTAQLPGFGLVHLTVHTLDSPAERLLVARCDEPFAAEERQMLQGMARVLGLALRGLRTLENERQLAASRLGLLEALERRERLLETLLRVQRSANQRMPLGDVLTSITEGAAGLLEDAVAALVLRDAVAVVSRTPAGSPQPDALMRAARRAVAAGEPIAHHDLIAAPVHIGDETAGALVIAGPRGDIRESERRDVLIAFAEQASQALTGADAHHDPLTRLPNRALFLRRLEQIAEAGTTAALLYLDLDLFKQVNDTYGHAAGDELLRGVADRLRAGIRPTDMAARLGGDEFAVLLEPIDDEDQARDIAQRLIDAIGRPFGIAGGTLRTRASVGIAYAGARPLSAQSLLEDADLAMYRAKKTQPGTFCEFGTHLRAEPVTPACP